MAETKGIFLTRHIGKTTYKVRVHLSETANETMEDKILRLIRNDGLAIPVQGGQKEEVYMAPSTAQAQGYERVSKYPKST